MAVTSINPGEVMARSGQRTIAATTGSTITARSAHLRDCRTAQQQKPHAAIARSAIHHTGAGIRRSAVWTALTRPMTAVMPWRSRAVTAPGSIAIQGLKSEAQNVMTATGARTDTSGTLDMFAGSANIVTRWK